MLFSPPFLSQEPIGAWMRNSQNERGLIFNGGSRDLWGREWNWPTIWRDMPKPDLHGRSVTPLDTLQNQPYFLAPIANRPEVITDGHRLLLMDPTDGSLVGFDGDRGGSGKLGRLVYAGRTPSSRSF